MLLTSEEIRSVVLIGFENTGKSTLFNALTQSQSSDERNFRGSTVQCHQQVIPDNGYLLTDTPGIRYQSDCHTTELTLNALKTNDIIVLVVRATHAESELQQLLEYIPPGEHRISVVLTFSDKVLFGLDSVISQVEKLSGVKVTAINTRNVQTGVRDRLLDIMRSATQPESSACASNSATPCANIAIKAPPATLFEHPRFGPGVAIFSLIAMFALPVWLAWRLSDWLQPLSQYWLIDPLNAMFAGLPPFISTLLFGSYGFISLGLYSFIWAFPVVVFIGFSIGVSQDSGIKERITSTLDPLLRKIGLAGQDLIPVLTGFGCNVVAVFQSRSCSRCSRSSCVSMISFGSACSYQLGASLSVFNASHHAWLFIPWLSLLFLTAALHNRIWYPVLSRSESVALSQANWLQWPRWSIVKWMVNNNIRQFLCQAMPIFLIICLVANLLDSAGVLVWLTNKASPLLSGLQLPAEVMPGIIFSLLRKDGLMILNQDSGSVLQSLSAMQTLLLVWLASTFSACLVTIWTVAKEISVRFAVTMMVRQALSSLVVSAILLIFILLWH